MLLIILSGPIVALFETLCNVEEFIDTRNLLFSLIRVGSGGVALVSTRHPIEALIEYCFFKLLREYARFCATGMCD